jgi:hypothetical protein
VSAELDFDHRRPGQQTGIDGFAESLNTLFNAVPNVYVELVTTTTTGNTVITDCAISGSVLIWPIYHRSLSIDHFVIIFGIDGGKIDFIQSLRQLPEEEGAEDDDDDGGAGPAPAGPRWVPRRPPAALRNQPKDAGPRWLAREAPRPSGRNEPRR